MNKASGGNGIPVELFQILKDDAVKVLHSICQHIWKTQQWPQDWKRSVFIPIPKKGNARECSNYCTIALISHASKVILKILQASFNSMWTVNFQMFKLDLVKADEPEIKLPTSTGSSKSKRVPEKHLLLLYWLCQSSWLCSVQFSRSFVSDSLWPHESQHARAPCPSPTPRVHPDPCPLSQWCHPTWQQIMEDF